MTIPTLLRSVLAVLMISVSLNLYAQNEDYIILNKTNCTSQVYAYCTGGASASQTLPPDGDWQNSCPTGETPCYVKMVLPGPTTVVATSLLITFRSPTTSLPPNGCYSSDYDWHQLGSYVVCNIY